MGKKTVDSEPNPAGSLNAPRAVDGMRVRDLRRATDQRRCTA